MLNVIDEPSLIQTYNEEYFKLINYYNNLKRTANFIKYYNLCIDIDPSKPITKETYDTYTKTQNYWDVYDLTPMYIIGAVQNAPEMNQDLKGNMIVSATTISTYTIDTPRIGDLVTFYKPVESDEILRVVAVRLQLNSNYSSVPLKIYELDLESAPIKKPHLDQLLKRNHFIYDLTVEKNIPYKMYKEYVSKMKKLEVLLNQFQELYLSTHDMYVYEGKIIVELNELVYLIKKCFDSKYYRLFEKVFSPFGYWDKYKVKVDSVDNLNFDETQTFHLIDLKSNKMEEYNLPSRVDDKKLNDLLSNVLELLIYAKDIDKYINYTVNANYQGNYLEHTRYKTDV